MIVDGRLSKTLERNKRGHSESSKQKIREKIKYMWKNGVIKGNTGHRHSEKAKLNMSAKKLGKKASEETKGKMRLRAKEHVKNRIRDRTGRFC